MYSTIERGGDARRSSSGAVAYMPDLAPAQFEDSRVHPVVIDEEEEEYQTSMLQNEQKQDVLRQSAALGQPDQEQRANETIE